MIAFGEAEALLRSLAPSCGEEEVALAAAAGRVAARDQRAPSALPVAARSAMDGFALRHADLAQSGEGGWLSVAFELQVGELPERPIPAGSCAAVATGSWLPPGADTVVPLEWTERRGDRMRVARRPEPGANVIAPGEEVREGAPLLVAGRRIGVRDLVALAALGIDRVPVRRRLRLAHLATGDELATPGSAAGPGRIYEATGAALVQELRRLGAEVRSFGTAPDDAERLADRFRAMLAWGPDAVLTTGGVSVGRRDRVPEVWTALGAETRIRQVEAKPGKAFFVASLGGVWIFGLSGTPGAALATYYALVRPALAALAGWSSFPDRLRGRLAEGVRRPPDRTRLVWARRADQPGSRLCPLEGEATLEAMAQADALLVLRRRSEPYRAGDEVEAVALDA